MNAAMRRFSRRQMRTRPARTLLTLASIVIGVAAISAVEMLAVSIRGASQEMFATVAGNAALVIQSPGDAPIDQDLVEKVEAVEGVEAAAPLVYGSVTIFTGSAEDDTQTKTRGIVLGIDPQRDAAMRSHELVEGTLFGDVGKTANQSGEEDDEESLPPVVLEENFARARDLKLGDTIRILGGKKRSTVEVVGIVRGTSFASAMSGGMAYLALPDAQKQFLGGRPQVTSIQIKAKTGADEEGLARRVNAVLPEGLTAEPPSGRTAVLQQTLHPTEQGLHIAVVFVTLLASFIVFNTFMMNVSERRRQLAIIRAVGGTRSQLFATLIGESLFLGLIGTLIGLFLGYQGTVFATYVLGQVLEVDFPVAELTPWIGLKASLFGLGIALVGVLYPAWRAARLTPLEALSPLATAEKDRFNIGPITAGTLLLTVGGIMLYATMQGYVDVTWGVYPALLMLVGMVVLAETLLVHPASTLLEWMIHPFFGPASTLARRQIVRHQSRSALTAGVLFIAAATGIGLSYVILDTVANVRDWYRRTITGDFYVRVALPDFSTGDSPETPEEFDDKISKLEGIRTMDRARIVNSKLNGVTTKVGAREYPTPEFASFDLVEGDPELVYDQLRTPDPETGYPQVVVSSVVAAEANVHAGDIAELDTPNGPAKVKVAAINNEYLVGGLMVWIHRPAAEKLLGITGYDGYVIMSKRGYQTKLRGELENLTKEYGLLLNSLSEIHGKIDGIIRSSDFMLWGLVFVEFVVAAFGMVNTLTMSVLEQTRELGMLRIIAMTRQQVRQTIEAQAIIIGLMGIVPGIAVGLLIAYLMNMATFASIAHPIAFGFHPWLVLGTMLGSMALVLIAAMVPARRAARIDVLQALQYE